ncbi:hypothetical protein N9Z41_00065 [bacterium]|nr:hypothetical protein [bacterium]
MSLVNELIKGLLPEEEKKQTTAVYAGGFKPPTSGHFEVVQQALKENPEIDEFIIFVGAKERNGISQTESLLIWEIYNNYLPFKVKIEPTSVPPIKAVYDFAKNHPTREVLWVIGAREGNEEDFKDITSRTKSISKYPNLELRTIVTSGGVSGTAARNAAKVSLDKFAKFVPDQLSDEETEEVYNIVADKIQEIQTPAKEKDVDPKELKMGIKVEMEHTDDPAKAKVIALQHLAEDPKYYTKLASLGLEEKTLNEAIDSSKFNFSPYIVSLTKHMLDNGMKLEPLPKVQMIHDDYENGENLFGNTAYYNPGSNSVILFTYGRHPKDILRSYAHELVHVHQNMEDRLTGLGGNTDVNQDDHLEQIEREAYETGNIMFRSWTDSITGNKLNEAVKTLITEKKKKDPFGLLAYAQELGRLREEENEYKVYLDMDGVLADFDQRFRDISGMEPREFENKYGTKAFWNLIDEENKIKFWVGIPAMPGAADLVNAVKDYNYELLTSPSAKKQSYLGKILWVKNHTGDVFPSKPRINFKRAKEKHLIKPELSKTDILIDDREDTIGRWNAAGGTGIVYKNISQVLNDLGKLGL